MCRRVREGNWKREIGKEYETDGGSIDEREEPQKEIGKEKRMDKDTTENQSLAEIVETNDYGDINLYYTCILNISATWLMFKVQTIQYYLYITTLLQ